jgi:hypothetical protein
MSVNARVGQVAGGFRNVLDAKEAVLHAFKTQEEGLLKS